MKFHQLAPGQIFLYQNQSYTKDSPVLATNNDTGEQKFMRRADLVEVQLASAGSTNQLSSDVINKSVVLGLIEQLFNASLKQLGGKGMSAPVAGDCAALITRLKNQLSEQIHNHASESKRIKSYKTNR